jgi:hypothetical protein
METGLIITELNSKVNLLSAKIVNEIEISEVTIKAITIRPFLRKINLLTEEFGPITVYDGEIDFETHKDDSNQDLITALLAKINSDF